MVGRGLAVVGRVEMASRLLETRRVPTAVGTGVGPPDTLAGGVGSPGTLMVVLGGRGLEDKEMGKAKGACTRVGFAQVWEVFASTAQMAGIRLTFQVVILHTGRRHREEPGSRAREGEGVPAGRGVGSVGAKTWLDEDLGSGGGMHEEGMGESCRAPLPVGVVLFDREKGLKAVELLKGILAEAAGAMMESLVLEHCPPVAEPVPPPSPTEYQRVVRLGHLLDQQTKLQKGLEEGRVRVEKARASA